ncbi:signal peptidase II [Leucobacter sp. CSA2]|uniref:Lipoprotein signal peptidase n=1 Tax=Leucobacter edaphi TaxID=2796472 RepID=A0A934QB69_9MICO|nr:signal peptidase II [Leucobacter edaphi]
MPLFLLLIAGVVFAADQLVKNWVVTHLTEGETVPVFGEFLRWHFVRNPGAAFSLASGSTWIFTTLAAVVVVVILWQIRRLRSLPWALFLGLLLGGVLGNLTDRLTREPGFPEGHVIDFISTPWMWLGFNEAIYNIADIGIVTGMIVFVLINVLGLPIDGGPRHRRADEPDAEDHDGAGDDSGSGNAPGAADADPGEEPPSGDASRGERGERGTP